VATLWIEYEKVAHSYSEYLLAFYLYIL
jgi:hypothetical protein